MEAFSLLIPTAGIFSLNGVVLALGSATFSPVSEILGILGLQWYWIFFFWNRHGSQFQFGIWRFICTFGQSTFHSFNFFWFRNLTWCSRRDPCPGPTKFRYKNRRNSWPRRSPRFEFRDFWKLFWAMLRIMWVITRIYATGNFHGIIFEIPFQMPHQISSIFAIAGYGIFWDCRISRTTFWRHFKCLVKIAFFAIAGSGNFWGQQIFRQTFPIFQVWAGLTRFFRNFKNFWPTNSKGSRIFRPIFRRISGLGLALALTFSKIFPLLVKNPAKFQLVPPFETLYIYEFFEEFSEITSFPFFSKFRQLVPH